MTSHSTSRGLLYTTPPAEETDEREKPTTKPKPEAKANRGHAADD